MLRATAYAIFTIALNAQAPTPTDLKQLSSELRQAISVDDLTTAAEIAGKLDDAVQKRFRSWLVRDARPRIDEVLTWLPAETESLIVHQEPFTITTESPELFREDRPSQFSSTERLVRLDSGRYYKALVGQIIRLIVCGTANMKTRGMEGVSPALSPNGDNACFYFFSEPFQADLFGTQEQVIKGLPAWRGTASILTGERQQPGSQEPPRREDETWLVLARPDLLMMASNHVLLVQIASRIVEGAGDRALPPNWPEWAHVNRDAPFWGLRHYSQTGALDATNFRVKHGTRPPQDPSAVGMTVQFDPERQQVEIEYLTDSTQLPRPIDPPPFSQFHLQQQPGLWRLTANTKERGAYPIQHAIGLLGFGGYR